MRGSFRWFRRGCIVFAICCAVIPAIGVTVAPSTVYAAESKPKFYAPKLIVPIPGLDFKQYPITRRLDVVSVPFLAAYIGAFARYLIGLSIIAAAIMVLYGGFLYITAASGMAAADGKKIISDALLGLVLILCSTVVLQAVNPSLALLKPLQMKFIPTEAYKLHTELLDGEPIEKMGPSERPEAPVGAPPLPTGPSAGDKQCGPNGLYKMPNVPCDTKETCAAVFCGGGALPKIDGMITLDQTVGFDDFPPTIGGQIMQKGLAFYPPGACYKADGCDATKYLAGIANGPKAPSGQKNRNAQTLRFRKEARDGLIKAGEIAKSKGYFIAIGDGTRTLDVQAQNFCQRWKDSGGKGTGGMAPPGKSPHNIGIGVDIALFKLEGGKYKQLTVLGGICGQVTMQQQMGPENLAILEEIMAGAGWRHMCDEVWHFNFGGVYARDCVKCEFPGEMQTRIDREKECKKK